MRILHPSPRPLALSIESVSAKAVACLARRLGDGMVMRPGLGEDGSLEAGPEPGQWRRSSTGKWTAGGRCSGAPVSSTCGGCGGGSLLNSE